MKKCLVVSLLVLALVPGVASAQGWLLPGLPGLSSLRGGSGCGDPGGTATFGADIAYVGYSRPTIFELTTAGGPLFAAGPIDFRQSYPVHGIQLSGIATVSANDRVTLIARGTWLIPWNGSSFENFTAVAPPTRPEREWTTSTQWWTAEGAAAWALNGMSAVVAGLRYDSLQTSFSDPSEPFAFFGQIDEGDLHVNLWIPYAGVVVQQGPARFGLIGTPWVPGNMRFRETWFGVERISSGGSVRNGYFLEAFGEFNANMMGATVGLFAKWTLVHARAVASLDVTDANAFLGSDTEPFDLMYDRPNWILGAQAALSFSSPF